jgi:hypothetical protein
MWFSKGICGFCFKKLHITVLIYHILTHALTAGSFYPQANPFTVFAEPIIERFID